MLEICSCLACSDFLTHDKAAGTFGIEPAQARLLTDPKFPLALGGWCQIVPSLFNSHCAQRTRWPDGAPSTLRNIIIVGGAKSENSEKSDFRPKTFRGEREMALFLMGCFVRFALEFV